MISGHANPSEKGATMGSAYLTIMNHSAEDVTLTKASSSYAKYTEFHTHLNEKGMMRMVKLKDLKIPAHATISMKPGGKHIMLIQLSKQLAKGNKVTIQLTDSKGNNYSTTIPIQRAEAKSDHSHH